MEPFDYSQDPYRYLSSFPPGYRFDPRDHELIVYYLKPKINGDVLPMNLVHEINIYNHNPEFLTASLKPQGENMWYFFTSRDRKYPNGRRPNRKAGDGYWKATGADKVIKHEGQEIGFRKALVFYKGKPPRGHKTSWIMHEFRVSDPPQVSNKKRAHDKDNTNMRLDDYILCRIYKKQGSSKKQNQEEEEEEIHLQEDNATVDSTASVVPEINSYNYTNSNTDSIVPVVPPINSYNPTNSNTDNDDNAIKGEPVTCSTNMEDQQCLQSSDDNPLHGLTNANGHNGYMNCLYPDDQFTSSSLDDLVGLDFDWEWNGFTDEYPHL